MRENIININNLKKRDEIKENPQMFSNIKQSHSFQYWGVL